jgi:hypothetical protein
VREGSGERRGSTMQESAGVRVAMHRFFDRSSANDVAAFSDVVELGDATLVMGTAPGEVVREEDRLRFGFEFEGPSMASMGVPDEEAIELQARFGTTPA